MNLFLHGSNYLWPSFPNALRRWLCFWLVIALGAALPTLKAKELPPLEVLSVLSPAYTRYQEVEKETARLLKAEDFAGLDALAQELRESKESLLMGTWLLSGFYQSAVVVSRDDPVQTEQAVKFYERWAAEKPESITAQVCLADAYTDYAWAARGSGWASTVTDEGQRLMDERLEKAWEVLKKARQLEQKCPQWVVEAQTVALGQGWSYDTYFKIVDEAIRLEPTYGKYYSNACYWLLPRWYGEEGDFEKWIAEQADAHPEKDKHYARLVWQADSLGMPEEMVFAEGRLDWDRTKRGFALWMQELPESLPLRFELLRLALLADDRTTAREQLEVTGGKYWPPNWNRRPEKFESARQFAYADGANPLLMTVKSRPASNPITPQVVQAVNIFAHIVGGLIAGALCLVLALQRKRGLLGSLLLGVCVVLAVLYGTMAAAVPAFVFVLYLWSKETADLPEKPPHSWGITLLWVLLVLGLYLGTQIVATVLAMIPGMTAGGLGANTVMALTKKLFISGEAFIIIINAQWLSLLLLLAVCGRQSWKGLRERLGLHPTALGRAFLYILAAAAVITASGFLAERLDDGRTQASLELIATGVQSPLIFFLAVVVLAPVFEELLMRGYAFQGWLPKFGFYGTAFLSSAIFAISHIQYGWAGLLHIFILGSVLGWVRWKANSVYPCIILHVMNNLAYFLTVVFDQP